MNVDSPVSSDASTESEAVGVNSGSLFISGSEITTNGAQRYTVSAYNDSLLVVNDSKITSGGSTENTTEISEPRSNEALLISGNARANFSIGATDTYYYDSCCTAEGWAALSTDSAKGDGLDLYAFNTVATAENGGYGSYADTNCRLWFYGVALNSAEIGIIVSKNGKVTSDSQQNATDEAMQYYESGPLAIDFNTTIKGGRNAIMMHAPDMAGSGKSSASTATLNLKNTDLITTTELVSTKNYADYSDAVKAYVDYVSGADLLTKSTSATMTLDSVNMESYSDTLLMTVLNSDSMGNFLHKESDGIDVNPVSLTMKNMAVEGNIEHMDYQRRLNLTLSDTSWYRDIGYTMKHTFFGGLDAECLKVKHFIEAGTQSIAT